MATMAFTQGVQMDPMAPGYSKTTRRQYQSCDQCRKSRRACDAGTLRVVNFPFAADETVAAPASACEACSNCAKSGKKCSFNWLRTLSPQGLPKGIKRKLGLTGYPESSDAQAISTSETNSQPLQPLGSTLLRDSSLSSVESLDFDLHENFARNPFGQSESTSLSCGGVMEKTGRGRCPNPPRPYSATNSAPREPLSVSGKTMGASVAALSGKERGTTRRSLPSFTRDDTSTSSVSAMSLDSRTTPFNPYVAGSASSICSDSSREQESAGTQSPVQARCAAHPAHGPNYPPGLNISSSTSTFKASRRPSTVPTLPSNRRQSSSTLLSPHQVRFADVAMKSMIANGLLRIYHDSFENSLSCWVTERNCPYDTELRELIATSNPGSVADEATLRLGDNRICSRVSRLDSAFAQLRGRELTAMENSTATKALHAAIMAFASQWSHSSHNSFWQSKEGRSQMKAWQSQANGSAMHSTSNSPDPVLSSKCERVIQMKLWHDAQKAIQASIEIDSFKVILAYMIFALTQRPSEESHRTPRSPGPGMPDGTARGGSHDMWTEDGSNPSPETAEPATGHGNAEWDPFSTDDIETISSPTFYLETAVRNLFSWRRKVERYRRLRLCRTSQPGYSDGSSSSELALKDQQTFNILFWLGVMCDTTSSAITKRPLVIPDEDCAMIQDKMEEDAVLHENGLPTSTVTTDQRREGGIIDFSVPGQVAVAEHQKTAKELWGEYLLKFKSAGPRTIQPRWPCSFESAAGVLQEAIPVKVLMFRKVAQLQTLAYRRSAPSRMEECIGEAIAVYQHWNTTYMPFMLDCVRVHNELPARVQSWYVILDGHWHYGCLLLADAIAQIDRDQQTMQPQRTLRERCGLIGELKRDNARAIADIAQASLAEHAPEFPDNPDFSFACNGSAILTEPWTDVLVRAMGSACKVFLDALAGRIVRGGNGDSDNSGCDHYDAFVAKAVVCIEGIALLGRKSDAANRTAEIFWARLNQVCEGHRRPSVGHLENEMPSSLPPEVDPSELDLNYLSRRNPIRC